MNSYQFAAGRQMPKGIDANEAGRVIERLISTRGEARPADVIEVARDPSNPLHACFEWDDTEAAHQHRLSQARYVLRAIVIVKSDEPDVTIRAFVNTARDGGWKTLEAALANPTDRELLLEQALNDARAFAKKYRSLSELGGVLTAIAQLDVPKPSKKRARKATPKRAEATAA